MLNYKLQMINCFILQIYKLSVILSKRSASKDLRTWIFLCSNDTA